MPRGGPPCPKWGGSTRASCRGRRGGRAGGGAAPGKSADSGVPSPAQAERLGRPPPRGRSLVLLRHPSPARQARLLGGLLREQRGGGTRARPGGAAGPPPPGRAGRGRAVSEAGRERGGGARGRQGARARAAGGRGKRGEPRRAGGGGADRLAVRFTPPAHAAVCFVDGTFPDSSVEPSSAPGNLRRDVPPEL